MIEQVSIATTTTNLLPMEPVHLYFFTWTHTSALPAIMGKRYIQERIHSKSYMWGPRFTVVEEKSAISLTGAYYWLWLYRPPFQLLGVPLPAHGRAGSPRRHALGTFCHIPPQPSVTPKLNTPQLPVALGVWRLCPQSQPARGPVLQRVHALLREGETAELHPAVRRVAATRQPDCHSCSSSCWKATASWWWIPKKTYLREF